MRALRVHVSDPGLFALKRAARAAIVMPAVFAFADQLIEQPETTVFAAFGSVAVLVLTDFGGPTRKRLTAYLGLAAAGVVLITLGTLCSQTPVLAVAAMFLMGFAVLFSGAISGYFAAARIGAGVGGQEPFAPGGNSRAVCRRRISMPTTASAAITTITRTCPRLLMPGMNDSQSRKSAATTEYTATGWSRR
jgi:hypothetical protein